MENEIIYVQWTNGVGGLEKISQAYEIKFAHMHPLVAPLRYSDKGIEYNNLFKFKNHDKLFFTFEYFLFVKKNNSKIFHLQYVSALILLLTYLAGAKKILYHFHGTKFSDSLFTRIVWKILYPKIIIIANSIHTKNTIVIKLKIKKDINIIPNLINDTEFNYNKRYYDTGDKFIITYAGRFSKGKNLNLLLEVVDYLNKSDKCENLEFRLYGEGPKKNQIKEKIDELSLNNIIKLFPFSENINNIYHNSNLFLFLSLYESFGNVVAEALLTGLPVICYRIPALTEFINDDVFFINKLDPEIISGKILFFIDNYSSINNRLEIVSREVARYLNNKRIVNELQKLYSVLGYKYGA